MKTILMAAIFLATPVMAAPVQGNEGPPPAEKKSLRVLLFADTPGRDFQFVRTLLARAAAAQRLEASVFLQSQSPEQEDPELSHLNRLTAFPSAEAGQDPKKKYQELGHYDVVLAFDPDWAALRPEQLVALEKWVAKRAGGLILMAGPIHTHQGAIAPKGVDLKPLQKLFPVKPADIRLDLGRLTTPPAVDPMPLQFPGAVKKMGFLRLDPAGKDATAGWDEFFYGARKADLPAQPECRRGFYGCYPVREVKKGAKVIATLPDPQAADKTRPFLVVMRHGKGRVVYLGGAGVWRLRLYREAYFERFWAEIIQFAARKS